MKLFYLALNPICFRSVTDWWIQDLCVRLTMDSNLCAFLLMKQTWIANYFHLEFWSFRNVNLFRCIFWYSVFSPVLLRNYLLSVGIKSNNPKSPTCLDSFPSLLSARIQFSFMTPILKNYFCWLIPWNQTKTGVISFDSNL